MTAFDRTRPKPLALAGSYLCAFLLTALASAAGRKDSIRPNSERPSSSSTPEVERTERLTYAAGYGLALVLTGAAFGLVWLQLLSGRTAFYAVLGLGFVQMLVHFRCFLHIDLRRNARADLLLLLFSSLIIALMVGGTLVILFNLHSRMMGPS